MTIVYSAQFFGKAMVTSMQAEG
ncbi:hypothetical protein ABEV92_15955 [Peribacillus muralis]|nr:hypothetical protein [Peribacillus muralis]